MLLIRELGVSHTISRAMDEEECGRGKRVKRVIVCRNGWHNCCLPEFEKTGPCSSVHKSSSPGKVLVVVETEVIVKKRSINQLVGVLEKGKSREQKEKQEPKTKKKKKDKYDHTLCEECARGDGELEMLLCDSCDRGYHMYCLSPILPTVPLGDWFCPKCAQSSHVLGKAQSPPLPCIHSHNVLEKLLRHSWSQCTVE